MAPKGTDGRRSVARAMILKAMAHPTRLRILELLAPRELCVCDIHDLVGSDLSTVSKHLALLRSAGLVAIDKRGTQVFYSLTVPCALKFIDCIDAVIRTNAKAQMEFAR